jgi:5-methylcytosine-specific restriction endonuclease McrA
MEIGIASMSCELCGRPGVVLTRHHLIPRTRHANQRARREFTREERQQIVLICQACHNQIHALFTEKELEREFNTLAAIAAHPEIARFRDWIRDKPAGFRPASKSRR